MGDSKLPVFFAIALADGICAVLWFMSISLDDPPFETESELTGAFLGLLALVGTGLSFAVAANESLAVWGLVALMKAFYLFGTLSLCMYMMTVKSHKLHKNYGYFLVGMPALLSAVVSLVYAFTSLSRELGSSPARRVPPQTQMRQMHQMHQMHMQTHPMHAGQAQPFTAPYAQPHYGCPPPHPPMTSTSAKVSRYLMVPKMHPASVSGATVSDKGLCRRGQVFVAKSLWHGIFMMNGPALRSEQYFGRTHWRWIPWVSDVGLHLISTGAYDQSVVDRALSQQLHEKQRQRLQSLRQRHK
ncbi:unnamed protein product [Effrenium voratum]|nr:unnamed protein product [Effrenium voratum]